MTARPRGHALDPLGCSRRLGTRCAKTGTKSKTRTGTTANSKQALTHPLNGCARVLRPLESARAETTHRAEAPGILLKCLGCARRCRAQPSFSEKEGSHVLIGKERMTTQTPTYHDSTSPRFHESTQQTSRATSQKQRPPRGLHPVDFFSIDFSLALKQTFAASCPRRRPHGDDSSTTRRRPRRLNPRALLTHLHSLDYRRADPSQEGLISSRAPLSRALHIVR